MKLYNDSEKKGYKICDLGKYCATGALSKDDIDASGKYPCILYGELFTKYGEVIKQVASRTNIIPTYLSGTNEILFPSSTTADAQSLIFPSSLKIKNIFLGGDLFTIKLKNEFDSDFISFYTATPLTGSRFYEYAKEHNLFDKETSFESAYYYPSLNTHHLSRDRVFVLHKSAIRRFYLRPTYILKMLSRIRSYEEVKNYFKAGINVLLRK